ncbi:MAG: LytTR family DNA-binding domain-containing protein [Ferruginibacter sp.]
MSNSIGAYSTIIVDDNEIDRLTTLMYARKFPFLQISGVYASADEALEVLIKTPADVLLLDIDMDGMNGLELRRQAGMSQACIFITAYPDYAVEGFELFALDFLIKPLQKDRFAIAMERLQYYLEIKRKSALFECSLGADAIFIKEGHDQVKIQLHDIIYLEALKDYTSIVTKQKKYCVLSVLGNLLEQTAFKTFIRIHRSYAVQKHFIHKITAQQLHVNDFILPIGRSYKHFLENIKKTT